jgi:hypothetical protein
MGKFYGRLCMTYGVEKNVVVAKPTESKWKAFYH